MMKFGAALLATLLCLQSGALAGRNLLQLPVLGAPAGSSPALAPAPAPGSLACAAAALQQSGNYTTLLQLIGAASESQLLLNLLNSADELATVFAPTDGGIIKAAGAANITLDSLLSQPELITDIISYHILPSQLAPADLQNNFSSNTLYELNTVAQSVAVQGNGASATIQGARSSAPIIGQLSVCQFRVYPIDGLLLPATS